MKVIISEGTKQFRYKKIDGNRQDNAIIKFIEEHSFYQPSFAVEDILKQIKQKVKLNSQDNNEIKNKLEQLSLYLNKDNNRLMFEIYEIVLKNPKGITYQEIANKTKLQIYNISHYCCRLKKMNFVKLKHEKSQKKVFPKDISKDHQKNEGEDTSKDLDERKNQEDEQQPEQTVSKPFHFHELSIIDNIWINVSSFESYQKNGVTNQDIKQKLNKTSQTKLIMKLVEQVKTIYQFERYMISKGKVFVNRYKNITKQILNIQSQSYEENDIQEKLNPRIEAWLRAKFPQFPHEKFLFHFINSELKGYLTASGVRSARRTCTPIKLVRYIKVLNSLNERWPQTHIKLKKYIIDEQKQIPNGTMHKRSIVGILDGLVQKGILRKEVRKEDTYYYPLWEPEGEQVQQKQENEVISNLSKPKKKVHLSLDSSDKKIEVGKKMSLEEYKKQLKVRLLWAELEELEKSKLKLGFKRIMFAKRSKTTVKMYEPETHIFNILDSPQISNLPIIRADNYKDFIDKIDEFVESEGSKEQPINVSYDVIKAFRKYPSISQSELKVKFGNNWLDKIKPLITSNILEQAQEKVWKVKGDGRYFL